MELYIRHDESISDYKLVFSQTYDLCYALKQQKNDPIIALLFNLMKRNPSNTLPSACPVKSV